MKYFTIKSSLFLVSSSKCNEEYKKIDAFLQILEKSGVGDLINYIYRKDKLNESGRKSYNPFNMFAYYTLFEASCPKFCVLKVIIAPLCYVIVFLNIKVHLEKSKNCVSLI